MEAGCQYSIVGDGGLFSVKFFHSDLNVSSGLVQISTSRRTISRVLYFLRESLGRVKIFCRLLLILASWGAQCNRIRYAANSTSILSWYLFLTFTTKEMRVSQRIIIWLNVSKSFIAYVVCLMEKIHVTRL